MISFLVDFAFARCKNLSGRYIAVDVYKNCLFDIAMSFYAQAPFLVIGNYLESVMTEKKYFNVIQNCKI